MKIDFLFRSEITVFVFLFVFLGFYTSVSYSFIAVDSSDVVEKTTKFDYKAENLIDRNSNTAWCVKKDGNENPWFSVEYDDSRSVNGVVIVNGYAKNEKAYRENARVNSILLHNGKEIIARKILRDSPSPQWVDFDGNDLSGKYMFYIEDIYRGDTYDDICVTEVYDDKRFMLAWDVFNEVRDAFKNRAMGPEDVKVFFSPIFENMYRPNDDKDNTDVGSFYNVVAFRSSYMDLRGLRILLDLSYYAFNFRNSLDAELTGGLRDLILRYIINKPDVVVRVLGDKNQLMLDRIADAYWFYVSSIEPADLEKSKLNVSFRELSNMILDGEFK